MTLTEKNAGNNVARNSISGGMDGRPDTEYIPSNRLSKAASTSSAKARIARNG